MMLLVVLSSQLADLITAECDASWNQYNSIVQATWPRIHFVLYIIAGSGAEPQKNLNLVHFGE